MEFDYDFDRQERKERAIKVFKKLLKWLLVLGVTVLTAFFIIKYTVEKTNITDNSMEITLTDGDTIIINKLAYIKGTPERFDVIVFNKAGKEHSFYSIKRVIGLPGEKIQIIDGKVYINDSELEEPMKLEQIKNPGLAIEPIILDYDEFFVLGDNRNDSEDSRFANIGNVVKEEIVGSAWIRTNKFGFVQTMNVSGNDAEETEQETETGKEDEKD